MRPALGVVTNLQLGPADAAPPAGAQALDDRLLGGPAPGEVLHGVFARLTELDFPLGEHASQELLAVLLHHAANAHAFHDIRADADDFHGLAASPKAIRS